MKQDMSGWAGRMWNFRLRERMEILILGHKGTKETENILLHLYVHTARIPLISETKILNCSEVD